MFDCLTTETRRRVLAGLSHGDPRVVQMSLSILDSALTDPEVADALLDRLAVLEPGDLDDPDNPRPGIVARVGRSGLSAAQLDRFLDLTTPLDRSGATTHLMPLVFSVPTCREHASMLRSDPRVSEDERKAVQDRLEMLQCAPDALWTQLLQVDKRLDEMFEADGGTTDAYDESEQAFHELVVVAAEHAVLRGRAARILQKWSAGEPDAPAIVAAHVLAANADAEALPALLRVIQTVDPDEDEMLRDRAMAALDHIRDIEFDEDSVEFLTEADQYDFQTIAEFVGRFRSDRAVDALIRCYREGSDEEYTVRGCVAGLMERVELTGEAREIALDEAMRDSPDDDLWDLPEAIATLSLLLGWDDERSRAVRARVGSAADRRKYRISVSPERARFAELFDRLSGRPEDDYDDDDRLADMPYEGEITPYVRAEPKVGRNDPCTCGSGKKYKKCCGK